MNFALWFLQILMGLFFIMNGSGKVFCLDAEVWHRVQHMIPWIDGVTQYMFIFIGTSEFLGGAGLILPAITRVKPALSAWAAVGMATVMSLATGFHLMRHEFGFSGLTAFLALIFVFIAYGRFAVRPLHASPLSPRSLWIGIGGLAVTFALVFLEFCIEQHVGA
jgi:uncharacterized membrane protein YphA (DoxX/SURF4 family)